MHALPQSPAPSPFSPGLGSASKAECQPRWKNFDIHFVALRIIKINLKMTWGNMEVHDGILSHKQE